MKKLHEDVKNVPTYLNVNVCSGEISNKQEDIYANDLLQYLDFS